MPPEQVVKEYTSVDPEDHETILRQTKDGCVFLDGNLCRVYKARPRACREFPYLVSEQRSAGPPRWSPGANCWPVAFGIHPVNGRVGRNVRVPRWDLLPNGENGMEKK